MNPEPQALDPREIKVLADILALVLEDQQAPSTVALETLRRRAKQNRITGGALKNVFQAIATRPPEPLFRNGGDSLPDDPEILRDSYERLRATNRTLEKALASANTESARLQAELDEVRARLVEAHQHNRGLAERWRSGKRQTTYLGAAVALCGVVILGLTVDQLTRPAAHATLTEPPRPLFTSRAHEPPRAPPPRHAAAARPSAPSEAEAAAPGPPERDPELEQALQRLSRTTALDAPAHPTAAPPAAPSAAPAEPAALAPPLPGAPAGAPAVAVGHLSPETYSAIVAHVRTCWRGYVSQLADPHFKARLQVVTDDSGVVREAQLARDERGHLADAAFQNFVRAAMRSVLDPQCAQLPIPPADLGHRIVFDFVFVP